MDEKNDKKEKKSLFKNSKLSFSIKTSYLQN